MTVTAGDVASWGKFPQDTPTGEPLVLLERVIAAVTEHVTTKYIVSNPLTVAQQQAVIMQCARLWSRRESPNGVAAFGDLGAIRVTSLDPDVRTLLNPQWNFA